MPFTLLFGFIRRNEVYITKSDMNDCMSEMMMSLYFVERTTWAATPALPGPYFDMMRLQARA